MGLSINLNADIGEGMGADEALLELVGAVSIACGAHAGDPPTMRRLVALAAARGVGIGAHPGFADREGFGRREIVMEPAAIEALVARQIEDMRDVCAAAGARLGHVKAHGALYNMAARDGIASEALCRAICSIDPDLVVIAPADSAMERAARGLGLAVAREAFPDRGYAADGSLLPRGRAGAVIADPKVVAARAVRMVREGTIECAAGAPVPIAAETHCIHGDRPDALAVARAVRDGLEAAGIALGPLVGARR